MRKLLPLLLLLVVPMTTTAQTETALFDFANNNLGLTAGQGGASSDVALQNAGNLSDKALAVGDVTMTFVNAATIPVRYYFLPAKETNHLQLAVKDAKLRLTAAEGRAIVQVDVVQNLPQSAESFVKWEVDKGAGTLSVDKKHWEGNATSVRFSATGATYINAITVTTAPVDAQTVTPEPDTYPTEVATLADFDALEDGTLVKLSLTDAVVTSGMHNEWGCYVEDATAGAHFYCTGLDFKVGDVLNGFVFVKKSTQTMGARIAMAEDTNADHLTITSGTTHQPVEGSVAQVCVVGNKCRLVRLTDVAVKGSGETAATITDGAGSQLVVNNGKTNYFPYVIQESLAAVDMASATVEGILFGSSTGLQLMPLSITDGTSGVASLAADTAAPLSIVSLEGIRLSQPCRGLNIINGRKVVVK